MVTAQEIIDRGVCPHQDGDKCHECRSDPSQQSYTWCDMADLTHDSQVTIFNWCGCEDGAFYYDDCPKDDQAADDE